MGYARWIQVYLVIAGYYHHSLTPSPRFIVSVMISYSCRIQNLATCIPSYSSWVTQTEIGARLGLPSICSCFKETICNNKNGNGIICYLYLWDNLISSNYGLIHMNTVRVCASQSILTAPKTILKAVCTQHSYVGYITWIEYSCSLGCYESDCVVSAISTDLWSNGEIIWLVT